MNRRKFFEKLGGQRVVDKKNEKQVVAAEQIGSVNTYANWSTDDGAAAHLVRRTMFGAPKSVVDYFKTRTLDQAVNELLTFTADLPQPPADFWTEAYHQQMEADFENGIIPAWLQVEPAPPVNDYDYAHNGFLIDDRHVPKGMPWVSSLAFADFTGYGGDPDNLNHSYQRCAYARSISFRGWWGRLILEQGNNIREKMTLFWHNHFAMRFLNNGQLYQNPIQYWNNALLRHHALGNFKTFIKAITLDPMMMQMLDVITNYYYSEDNKGINENYARELQELFTLGLKPDDGTGSSYNDDDIYALARILTGWRYNTQVYTTEGARITHQVETVYHDHIHDSSDKQFSAFFGNAVVTGQSGPDGGEAELDAFLNILFNTQGQTIGRFIAREIYRFFVRPSFAYDPQAANNDATDILVENEVIIPMANAFVSSNYEIKPMMELLLKSENFFADCNRGCMIKSPIDFITGLYREFGVSTSNVKLEGGSPIDDINLDRVMGYGMLNGATNVGQNITNPVNVHGWDAYFSSPYDKNWVNGATFARRVALINDFTRSFGIAYNTILGNGGALDTPYANWYLEEIDLIAFTQNNISNPANLDTLVDEICDLFFPLPIHDSVKLLLKCQLCDEMGSYIWVPLWTTWVNNPSDIDNLNSLKSRLRIFYRAVFTLEEYHLM